MTEAADISGRPKGLTPGHWIAIATIAIGVLSAVLGGVLSWVLSEHNARLANVEATTNNILEVQPRVEGQVKSIQERLNGFEERVEERFNRIETGFDQRFDRIENNIDRLIQLHLDADAT